MKDNVVKIIIEPNTSGYHPYKSIDGVDQSYVNAEHNLTISLDDVLVLAKESEDFYYEIVTPDEAKTVLYSTKDHENIFLNNFIKDTVTINTNGRLFGLGQRFGDLLLTDATYTIWNKDTTTNLKDGRGNENPGYGTYPVYYY